jgi:hypothetical protein
MQIPAVDLFASPSEIQMKGTAACHKWKASKFHLAHLGATRSGRMMNNDLVYLHRRADEERTMAMSCQNNEARRIHLELAGEYEFRALLLEQLAALKAGKTFACDPNERADAATADDPEHLEQEHWRADHRQGAKQ